LTILNFLPVLSSILFINITSKYSQKLVLEDNSNTHVIEAQEKA